MSVNRFLQDTVRTAPPHTLLVMLYDRLVLDVRTAIDAIITNERVTARSRLQHAQAILLELRSTLKLDDWPEGAGLAALYTWCYTECSDAWLHYDVVKARNVLDVVSPLRDTWREAATLMANDRPQLTSRVV